MSKVDWIKKIIKTNTSLIVIVVAALLIPDNEE